jgi:tetratricopeptide (TPR) repeat protein
VLRLVAQTLDSELGYRHHTRALATGLQALDEADDFATRGVSAASDLQVAGYVAGHRTPALKQANLDTYTPITAMQAYYEYAMRHLSMAGNHEPVASSALYGLGQIDMRMTQQNGKSNGGGPTPVAFFQTALAIDPSNADAANELGVLMARYGQWDQAAMYLEQSLSVKQTQVVAANLAEVRRRQNMGSPSMQPMPMTDSLPTVTDLSNRIQWVDPPTFARAGTGPVPPSPVAALPQPTTRVVPNFSGEPTPAVRPQPNATSAIPQHPMSGFAPPQPVHGDSAAAAARGVSDWFRR